MGFGVWGLGFGVWGLGSGVWGLGFGVWVWGLGLGGSEGSRIVGIAASELLGLLHRIHTNMRENPWQSHACTGWPLDSDTIRCSKLQNPHSHGAPTLPLINSNKCPSCQPDSCTPLNPKKLGPKSPQALDPKFPKPPPKCPSTPPPPAITPYPPKP